MRIDIRSLGYAYPGSAPVFSGLDLTIADGECHALVGPSGCGKTTLLRLIAGLEAPTAGTIEFVGRRSRANLTSMVFQTPRLVPWWDVGRNVGISSEFAETESGVYQRIRDLYTSMVGLGGLMHRLPKTLSRGQQSRAGVGRALAHDAEVLLMDEPFAALDMISRTRMTTELERLWMRAPRTAVLVTHDVDEAVRLGDRVTVLSFDGTVVDTIPVESPRPRSGTRTDEGIRRATGRVWATLDRRE